MNFLMGGKLGDFLHAMFAVKHTCQSKNITANVYILPDISGTKLVFDIKVIDSIGLSSSVGVYSVNAGGKLPFKGTFSYTTL